MNKIKGQGTLTKSITSRLATSNRNHFLKRAYDIDQLLEMVESVNECPTFSIELVSFSSARDYPEQVLSILSFMRYVGQPLCWTIYSDGSHTAQHYKLFEAAFPFVQLVDQRTDEQYFDSASFKDSLRPYQHELRDFARQHFLGKRLSLYLNHAVDVPTLFLDSDIVFYKQSAALANALITPQNGWYLPDSGWGCLDSRYVAANAPEPVQVNAGFFLMAGELANVDQGLHFLKGLACTYEYFSEQTIMHILLNTNQYQPLDSRKFVVDTADQFDFSYAYTPDNIALRHYTGPVRHKMWQRNWRWHLSLA